MQCERLVDIHQVVFKSEHSCPWTNCFRSGKDSFVNLVALNGIITVILCSVIHCIPTVELGMDRLMMGWPVGCGDWMGMMDTNWCREVINEAFQRCTLNVSVNCIPRIFNRQTVERWFRLLIWVVFGCCRHLIIVVMEDLMELDLAQKLTIGRVAAGP